MYSYKSCCAPDLVLFVQRSAYVIIITKLSGGIGFAGLLGNKKTEFGWEGGHVADIP